MNNTASRRQLPGSGASPLILALSEARTTRGTKLDDMLFKLCAEMEIRQAAVVRVDQHSKITDEEADVILDDWWETVVAITDTPAKTPEGLLAKARAVRTALIGNHGDRSPKMTEMLSSLFSDLLGEDVQLP